MTKPVEVWLYGNLARVTKDGVTRHEALGSGGSVPGAGETIASIHTPWVRHGRCYLFQPLHGLFLMWFNFLSAVICLHVSTMVMDYWDFNTFSEWYHTIGALFSFTCGATTSGRVLDIHTIEHWGSDFKPHVSGLRRFWPNTRVWGYSSWWVQFLEGSGITTLRCGGWLQELHFVSHTGDLITFWTFVHTIYGLFICILKNLFVFWEVTHVFHTYHRVLIICLVTLFRFCMHTDTVLIFFFFISLWYWC